MYPKYFGLKEPSFSIAPDPHYLYLSEQHKEALAHLLYGAGEGGGFVLLTGEVGTGKTTVCRAFLEQLPENVDVALILNPNQTARELLLSIFDEFRIALPEGRRSIKTLIDRLNEYLLESYGNGRRPVLIIDEAQNLDPAVLEQIRLLTNLETTKHKLLQIFLIGQPELRALLDSEELRQLNQRITARFHLVPFGVAETGAYIRHRVAVAGVDRPLFTAAAIRLIYRYSGGVPRLINILCDRALLGVCVSRGSQVTPAVVNLAAREIRGDRGDKLNEHPVGPGLLAFFGFCLALLIGWGGYVLTQEGPEQAVSRFLWAQVIHPMAGSLFETTAEPPASPKTEAVAVPGDGAEPKQALASTSTSPPQAPPDSGDKLDAPQPAEADATETLSLTSFEGDAREATLRRLSLPESEAMTLLLSRWGLVLKDLPGRDPCYKLPSFGLSCAQEQGTLANIRFFDLPALLRVANVDGERRFVVVTAMDDNLATVELPSGRIRVPAAGLGLIWTGDYTLVWQPPPGGATVIGAGSSGESVRWLRQLLAKLPDLNLPASESGAYDGPLIGAVRSFQTSKGLAPDGVAGPRTLITLNNAIAMPGIPRLTEPSPTAEKETGAP